MFTKLEDITSIHTDSATVLESVKKGQLDENVMKDFITDSKNIFTKLDEVTKVATDIKDDIAKIEEKRDAKQLNLVAENAGKVMPVLDKINNNISSLVEQLGASSSSEQPSVRPKEKKLASNTDTSTSATVEEEPDVEIIEIKKRKALFFSSSIGLQCDLQEVEQNLDSKIQKVKTFHIEKHTNAKDPELFLRKNLEILDESKDIDYIIISVGTNDITKLNLEEDIGDLNNTACEHTKNLAHLANATSQKYNIDVFLVERPARFDKKDRDPEGIRSVLTISSNGLFPSLITPLKRVHYIPLPSLTSGRAKKDCFVKDGVHLSPKGEKLFCLDIVEGVKSVFSDIKQEPPVKQSPNLFQKAGKRHVPGKEKLGASREDHQPQGMVGNQKRTSGFGAGHDDVPGGWNGNRKPNFYQHNESNDRKYNTGRFQQGGNQDNRQRNYHNHKNWQGPVRQNFQHNNRQYDGYERSRQHSDRQYRQNGQNREQTQYRQNEHREQTQYRQL